MRLDRKEDVILSNTPTLDSHDFEVGDVSVIMELLSKLYSRPIQTLTQEYISNARDAHRDAGQTRPIEITAPTTFNPKLTIRDYGMSLSPEQMKTIPTKFGVSTKRKDNTTTGGYGVGIKSFWSYGDIFLIITFFEGRKRTYKCERRKDGAKMELIQNVPTTEPTGLQIEFAVASRDCIDFQDAIIRCVKYWKESERPIVKNLNIKYPKLSKITDKVYINKDNTGYHSEHKMIVDGIPYPVSNSLAEKSLWKKLKELFNCDTYIFFETGEVNVAPTREELLDSEDNAKKINKVLKTALQEINDLIKEELKKGKTFREKIDILAELIDKYKVPNKLGEYKIDGNLIKSKYFGESGWRPRKSEMDILEYFIDKKGGMTRDRINKINKDNLKRFFYVDIEEGAVKTCSRYRKYMNDNSVDSVYIITGAFKDDVVKDLGLKGVSSLALPSKSERKVIKNKNTKVFGHWYFDTKYDWKSVEKIWKNVDDIKIEVYYFNRGNYDHEKLARYFRKDFNFAGLSSSHIEKIKDKKNFKSIEDFIKNFKFKDEHLDYFIQDSIKNQSLLRCVRNDIDAVKDKDFKKALDFYTKSKKLNAKALPAILAKTAKDDKKVKEVAMFFEKFTAKIDNKYPLLNNVNYYHSNINKPDLIRYINERS